MLYSGRMILNPEKAAGYLRDAASEIERGASMEGSIRWEWGDEPGTYRLQAFYRVGNDMGQGGAVIVKEDWPQPEDASLLERDMLAEENASPEEP